MWGEHRQLGLGSSSLDGRCPGLPWSALAIRTPEDRYHSPFIRRRWLPIRGGATSCFIGLKTLFQAFSRNAKAQKHRDTCCAPWREAESPVLNYLCSPATLASRYPLCLTSPGLLIEFEFEVEFKARSSVCDFAFSPATNTVGGDLGVAVTIVC
ncbi:hypothetical protein CHU98_g1620 [Xylaria longipes]|nr:hypothetical protein CHU98_g1620 [Xylaria longipes]